MYFSSLCMSIYVNQNFNNMPLQVMFTILYCYWPYGYAAVYFFILWYLIN